MSLARPTRRAAIRALATGLVVCALAPRHLAAAEPPAVQPFALPELPWAYDALEPHFDARTMEIHHRRHHQAYIDAANRALAARPDLRELTAEQLVTRLDAFDEPLRSTLRNQLGGHLNHSFFWSLLAPPADYRPGPLQAAIARDLGSMEAFRAAFSAAAASRFGSGWVWLAWKDGVLEVFSTANQDSPLMTGHTPIIGLDVWEHAYYLAYQNRRADYVGAFWKVLNWDAAEAAYAARGGI